MCERFSPENIRQLLNLQNTELLNFYLYFLNIIPKNTHIKYSLNNSKEYTDNLIKYHYISFKKQYFEKLFDINLENLTSIIFYDLSICFLFKDKSVTSFDYTVKSLCYEVQNQIQTNSIFKIIDYRTNIK